MIMRLKGSAEVNKLKAETDKLSAEAEQIRLSRKKDDLINSEITNQLGQNLAEISLSDVDRACMTEYYIREVDEGSTIEIISLTLQVVLENYGEDRILKWVKGGKKFRILILYPFSMGAKLRSLEESDDESFLTKKINKQVLRLKDLYEMARKFDNFKHYNGSLEVRFYDGIPYFAYFRTENTMALGLYYSHIKGLQSEVVFLDKKTNVYKNMTNHFSVLWEKGDKKEGNKMTLCIISEHRMSFNDPNDTK